MAIFTMKEQVKYLDLDKDNKLTNRAIINLMQDVAGAHSESIGDGLNYKDKNHTAWILLNWKIEVYSRPKYLDTLTINTWTNKFDKCFSYRNFEIYCDDKIVARASSKWVLINSLTGKIEKVSEEKVKEYKPEDKLLFEKNMQERLKEPEGSNLVFEERIGRTKIDTNNHLNNVYYLDFATESLPEEVYEKGELNNIEIMYKKASKYNETIMCYYAKDDEKHVVTIKDEEGSIHAIVRMW